MGHQIPVSPTPSGRHYLSIYRYVANVVLSLAGTGHFASFHGTRGVGTTPLLPGRTNPPCAQSPLIELKLRGKNEHVARRKTKRFIYKLKVLGQAVTSEVRSSAEKWRKPVIADNGFNKNIIIWLTLLLMELEQNFNVQRVPYDEWNTLRWFLNAHGWFLGIKNKKNNLRVIWHHWPLMTRWFHDLISSLLSAKLMSESKSAPQITLEGSRTRRKSAKVIDLIWPQLTSIDLRRTGWPVECMSTTWYYMSTFISLAKTAMFVSYVPRNAFSAWHDPSYDVIGQMLGVRVLKFSGGRTKYGGESYRKTGDIRPVNKKDIPEKKTQEGLHQPPCSGEGILR